MEIIKRLKPFFLPRLVCKTTEMHAPGVALTAACGKDGGQVLSLPGEPQVAWTRHVALPVGPGHELSAKGPCSVTAPFPLPSAKATPSSFSHLPAQALLWPFLEVRGLTSLPVNRGICVAKPGDRFTEAREIHKGET